MRITAVTILNEKKDPCWNGYEQIGLKKKGKKDVPNCVPKKESFTNEDFASLIDEILNNEIGEGIIDDLKITNNKLCNEKITSSKLEGMVNEALTEYYFMTEETLNEAEYKGRKVQLGKISKGDRKKYKVHVKNDKGNVVKVEFGDPNMEIKRDNPERRKNFRARHHCDNPGPRWKARYWSCRNWGKTPVSKMLESSASLSNESFMATRSGALGETFGEAPKLSQCCQQEIINNDKCSHCGKVCKEMPN